MINRADFTRPALDARQMADVPGPRADRRGRSSVVAVALLAATTTFAFAGCANEVEDPQALVAPSERQVGADEFYKITMSVTNSTNQTFWIKSAELGHEGTDGGAWGDRATNLAPGDSETVSAYSAIQGQGIKLLYETPDQTLSATLMAQDPAIGKNNVNGTKATSPLVVKSSITDGRQCTATFMITG